MKIGIIANNTGRVSNPYNINIDNIFKSVGDNTGNLMFWYSVNKLFEGKKVNLGWDARKENTKHHLDLLVFPAANWLNERQDLQKLSDMIESFDIPCLIVGLGAQSSTTSTFPILKKGTINFLKNVSKRTNYVFVRGQYSKNVCEHYGIINTKVTGCSSILINENQNLGKQIQLAYNKKIDRLLTIPQIDRTHLHSIDKNLILNSHFSEGKVILQAPLSFLKMSRGVELDKSEEEKTKYLTSSVLNFISQENLNKFGINNFIYYSDVEHWIDEIKIHSHSIGLRIHGTIASLMAEIPAICITHDTRTQELSDTLKIANISHTEFEKTNMEIKDLFYNMNFDGNSFDENRRNIANTYTDAINELGMKPSQSLLKFVY